MEAEGRGETAAVQAACREAPTVGAEARARSQRTANMPSISVTLDVSRLSGWLNADALCRVKGSTEVRCGPGGRRCGLVPVQAACRKAPTVEAEGRARAKRTPNIHSMVVTLDVSRLSGWLNADAPCRVTGEARRRGDMRAGSGGRGEA